MRPRRLATVTALLLGGSAVAAPPGLLFRMSADKSLTADVATGDAAPNFLSGVTIVPDGAIGGAARWADEGYVAWHAPGNMQAARGTLSFFWRSRTPAGEAPFVIFRAGFADHSSWDMAFLRIDWNGHGFDAFVTDANLSRVRVSWTMPQAPAPADWHHIAFAWDETVGVRLYVDGREVAAKLQKADLDSGLDQFGLAGRVLSPHQVQSRYNFMRGSDLDEIRVYDAMLGATDIAALAAKQEPAASPTANAEARRSAWLHRYGWDRASPPVLDAPVTRVRKVEFADAKDLKEWMWKGIDGIAETTWPGVYNRSRLPGRNDYFQLPDWNVYVEGGKTYDLTVPPGERIDRIEISGAAYGDLSWSADGQRYASLATRPQGVVRSVTAFPARQGGMLRFTNVMQEQPIQEIWAYDVGPGAEPAGSVTLAYRIDAAAASDLAALDSLNAYIAGRFPPDERSIVVAMPQGGTRAAVGAGDAAASGNAVRAKGLAPIVHVLIPASFGDAHAARPLARAWDYGWQNMHDGLDGIAIDLPALKLAPRPDGLIPLNIRVKDPIWPGRDMIDLSISVRPNEKRTLWLDLRDRILPNDSLYLTIASAVPGFDAQALDGAAIRLVFKDRAAALPEHVADRLDQVKDNWGFLVEEHTASKRAGLYQRLFADIGDLLRVDPDNKDGRAYWADVNYRPENFAPVALPPLRAGVPVWAQRQLQDLALVRRFVDWWIDNRQVPYGDFGGGISDDTDLTQQWPGLALMGVEPDKLNASLRMLTDAAYRNGMHTNGLGTIETDELHAYEEGLNADAQRLYLNWGEPLAVERLMATAKALQRVILPNPAGHLHFASSWYGGRKIYRDDPWAWQKPYAFVIMHAPILIGLYNGNPQARGLVTGLVDGWLAHGKQGVDGQWTFPNEINWYSDHERVGDGGGLTTPLQSAWAAWRFSGDAKYLRPIHARVARAGPGALAEYNENAFDLLPQGPAWRKALAARGGDPFARYAAWAETGSTDALVTLHEDAIREKMQHEAMLTTGHWWSDRVEQPSELLQRERLGGIALRRGQLWPGNTVSWRFAEPDGAGQVAILVPGARQDRFRVIAYNMSPTPIHATMTGWNVTAGRWSLAAATSRDSGKTLTPTGIPRDVVLERGGGGAEIVFAPGTTTVLNFALVAASMPAEQRPDLGIGAGDVTLRGRTALITVHSLGAQPTAGGEAMLVAGDGTIVARAAIPPLAAPLDLIPKTVQVRLAIPAGAGDLSVRIALPGDAPEVTLANNRAPLRR